MMQLICENEENGEVTLEVDIADAKLLFEGSLVRDSKGNVYKARKSTAGKNENGRRTVVLSLVHKPRTFEILG